MPAVGLRQSEPFGSPPFRQNFRPGVDPERLAPASHVPCHAQPLPNLEWQPTRRSFVAEQEGMNQVLNGRPAVGFPPRQPGRAIRAGQGPVSVSKFDSPDMIRTRCVGQPYHRPPLLRIPTAGHHGILHYRQPFRGAAISAQA